MPGLRLLTSCAAVSQIAQAIMTGAQVIVPPIISSLDNTPPGPSIRSITRATATLHDM